MHAQIRHRAHCGTLFVKEPGALTRIDTPRFRTAVAECRCERDYAANLTLLNQLARLDMCARQTLVLVNHQLLPLFFAALTMRSQSSSVVAIGFSHSTCLPASSAATAICAWLVFAEQMLTASTFGSASRASTLS